MKKRFFVMLFFLSASSCLTRPAFSAEIQLRAVLPTLRMRPKGEIQGETQALIGLARNEVESIQIVVTARDGLLENVEIAVSELQDAQGNTIPAEGVLLYREVFVPVRHPAPRASRAPGLVPDPLVPVKNPYTGETLREGRWDGKKMEGPRFGAVGFLLWEGHHQPFWLDVRAPADAVPGTYTGTVRVTAAHAEPAEIPVEVTVWDFQLPEGPTHENHFGGFHRVASYHGMDPKSDAFQVIEDRYIQMMADHRINPPLPSRLLPPTDEEGNALFDEELDGKITAFVEKFDLTNIQVPRRGGEEAGNYYASWQEYLERKNWLERSYLYMKDEPNDPEAYEYVRKTGALVKEAAPKLRRLVVEQPYTQNEDWGVLDGAIDIWCPLFCFVHEESIHRVQTQGDEVWSYTALVQQAPPYDPEYESVKGAPSPWWQIDFPLLNYRVAPWLNRRYDITGLLYWSTCYWGSPDRNPWDDPGFRVRWNGDGFLFYPGDEAGIEGPVSTLRLKNLRDGMEDYEYFVLLEKRGGKDLVDRIVREAVPTWSTWSQDPETLPRLRRLLAQAILERG